MANKSTRLMLDALTRAAAEPAGLPLFAARGGAGLFPSTAAARQVAQRCKDDGFLQVVANGKPGRENGTLTTDGLNWLLSHSSPRQILEDFVRVLEERRGQVAQLIATTQNLSAGLNSLAAVVDRLRPHMHGPERNGHLPSSADRGGLENTIVSHLEAWHESSPGDCPLPELFQRLHAASPGITFGGFHDALRSLHDGHRVWLHPWTGPLYQLPEPALALLIGHEIAYYASLRNAECGTRSVE